ncbi:MAG: hypothetical protein K0Q95_2644 [Bacteroidota bacterium]|jgi:hypothetical protein|nr:hypothetical protein [Bacteroidota bacterium]
MKSPKILFALITFFTLNVLRSQTIDLQMTVINASSATACDGEMDIQCTGCSPFVSYIWADTNSNIIGSGNHISGVCPTYVYCYQLIIVDYACFNQVMFAPMRVASVSGPNFQLKTSMKYSDSTDNFIILQQVSGGAAPYSYSISDDYDYSPGTGSSDYVIFADSNLMSINNIVYDSLYDPYGDISNQFTLNIWDTARNFIGYYFSPVYDTVNCTPSYNHVWVNAQGYAVSDSANCDGFAYGFAYGGTPPYTYSFSSGATDSTETGLCPGAYSVTATDGNNYQRSATFVVGYPGTYYITDPGNYNYIDTLYANAEMECGIDYSQPVTNYYVDTAYAVSPYQYVLQWVIEQDTNVFEFTETYWADSAGAYLFGFSLYCSQRSFGSYSFLYGLDPANPVATAIHETETKQDINVFPNPSTGRFTLSNQQEIKSFVVVDQLGREVKSSKGASLNTIDLSELQSAVYYAEIVLYNGKIIRKKLVKN